MEIQKSILLFFSGIHNKYLDALANTITVFGEELVPLAIILFIYWCVDKKKGFVANCVMMIANNTMLLVKSIVRFPRPWVLIPELDTQRLITATGYSFPSGHSTTAASFYSALAFSFRKKWFSIVCAVIILLVPISRMYLCVHWPMDVACGLILGVGTTLILYTSLGRLYDNREKHYNKMIGLGIVIACAGLGMAVLVQAGKIDSTAFTDFYKSLGMLSGVLIAFPLEEKKLNFKNDGKTLKKIIRFIVGMAVAYFILEVVKKILPYVPVISFIRYFAVTFWACIYPMLGKKLGLFE